MKTKRILLISLVGAVACTTLIWLYYRHEPEGRASRATATKATNVSLRPMAPPPRLAISHQPSEIPDSIRPIFGLSGQSFATRFKALHSLGKELSRAEIEALYAFLRSNSVRPGALIGGEHVLKNDVLNLLLNQVTPPADLLPMLRQLYHDQSQDSVTRDYALQHVVSFCVKIGQSAPAQSGDTNVPSLPVVADTQQVLWEALTETDSSIAGTALLGLHRLSAAHAEIDPNRVSATALKLIQDPTTGELSLITAVQVCAQREIKEALPLVRNLAKGAPSLPLQISAIAAVGDLGGAAEQAFLEGLRAEGNKHLQPAVQSALRRLRQRLDDSRHFVVEPNNKL
jgi:hypothetical protein